MNFEIKKIRKKYGKKAPLESASFSVKGGECVGIIGKNGSGKSTLLSILAGVQRADGGSFSCDDASLFENKKLLSEVVGYVPQGTPLIEELSARDNLLLWYDKKSIERELSDGILKLLGVDEFLSVPVKKMSGGMKKRLSIACAMAKKPDLLLLDEPCAALDLICKASVCDYLEKFKAAGGAIVLTTHDESELSLCDRIYILKDGILSEYNYNGDVSRLTSLL